MPQRSLRAVLALSCALALSACAIAPVIAPAYAAEVATLGDKAVVLPWGDWLVAILQLARDILVPILTVMIMSALYKIAPWAQSYLTNARVESMVQHVTAYGINAVGGAVRGKTIEVDVGAKVIASAVQRAVDAAPATVVAAAGGPQGVAKRVFRSLDLAPEANLANTLAPVLARLPGASAELPITPQRV